MSGYVFNVETIEKLSAGEVYGKTLAEMSVKNKNIVMLTADLVRSNKAGDFKQAAPDRFFNFGIAEQNMMAAAAGLAVSGKIPYVSTMAAFASMRACEQVRTDIAYPNLNVRIIATHSGLSMGNGGSTHHSTEDLAIMRSIPNMTVIVPACPMQCRRILLETELHEGPIYMRIGRGAEPVLYPEEEEYEYKVGKAIVKKDGTDLTVIGCSFCIMNALFAAERLEEDDGINIRVIDMHTIKPIDKDTVLKAAAETGGIITVEDHNIIGGLGSAVAEVLAESSVQTKFKRLGVPDLFSVIGDPEQLHNKYGYDEDGIYEAVKEMLGK